MVEYRIPTVNLDQYEIERTVLTLLSRDTCERLLVLPVSRAGRSIIVAMIQPIDAAIHELSLVTGLQIEPVLADEAMIRLAIDKYYPPLN